MDGVRLSEALLSHAGEARERIAAAPALEETLAGLVAEARRAWPGFTVTDEAFLRHLGERLAAEPVPALEGVHAADLYLACACAAGDPGAIAELEARFMPRARAFFARNGSLAPHADELMQLVRMRLLVADGTARPRIAEYSGRAPFGAWFRVVVARFAMNYSAAHKLEPTTGDDALAAPDPDPELAYLRAHHQADVDAAFAATLAALPPRTATLLRLYYLDGVPAEAIGKLHGVSGRTVQRWIADTRAQVLRETQQRLGEKLRLSASQVGSLIALMRSRVDVSIHRFFDPPEG